MSSIEFQQVKTPWGILKGRDAIYLDWVSQAGHLVELSGRIDGNLSERREKTWFHYLISLRGVFQYEAFELDVFDDESIFRNSLIFY